MNTPIKKYFIFLFFCAYANGNATFPPRSNIGKETLLLNGTGLRTATIFSVKVYEAGLYLKEKSQEIAKIIPSYPKKIELHFLRNIGREDIVEAWKKSFPANCEQDCVNQTAAVEKLQSLMVDVKENDKMAYTFFKDKVEVFHNEKKLGEITQASFPENLLLTWIGKEPPTEELKKGILGLAK